MEYSFADKRWLTKQEIESGEVLDKDFALGLHVPGVYDKVLDIEECFLTVAFKQRYTELHKEIFQGQKYFNLFDKNSHRIPPQPCYKAVAPQIGSGR